MQRSTNREGVVGGHSVAPAGPIRPLAGSLWGSRGLIRTLRVAATGFCFLVFGLGALVLAGALLPLSLLGPSTRERVARRWIRRAFRLFTRVGSALRLWDVRFTGMEHLDGRAQLIVANHPTLLDVVFLLSQVEADCVVKKEAWRNPVLRGIVTAAGYVPNDRGRDLITACSRRIAAGRSVLLFPEGSRSPARGLREFRRGAARIAVETGCPVLPVVARCEPPALMKGQAWYALPNEKLVFSFQALPPVRARDHVREEAPHSRAARRFNDHLTSLFRDALHEGNGIRAAAR
jgi:1-acyl-sn-glycerol-3-phosphate acyltransferase